MLRRYDKYFITLAAPMYVLTSVRDASRYGKGSLSPSYATLRYSGKKTKVYISVFWKEKSCSRRARRKQGRQGRQASDRNKRMI